MPENKTFARIRQDIADIPVIDCHEHTGGFQDAQKYEDALTSLLGGYIQSDMLSASNEATMEIINDTSKSLEERWPIFKEVWKRTEHTGYARVTKWVLREYYGESELTLDTVKRIEGKLIDLTDESVYWGILDKAGIRCRLQNIWKDTSDILDGTYTLTDRDRYLIPLPGYHSFKDYSGVQQNTAPVGRNAVTLDEYVDICRDVFTRLKGVGAIGMKDQSAYERTLYYESGTRAEAEKLFGRIMEDPRKSLGWPESKPLEDYLFHQFMKIARDLDMPVQIHTGHMAGIRNDISKTNAVQFTNVLELHRDVQFDLFHANWPYSGELLYLGKNYPNVALDFCWAHIVDPVYSQDMLAQAVTAVPHGKIFGFGGDYGGIEYAAGHLEIARDNIAWALTRHLDSGWLGHDEAVQIAADWLFNNPNRFWRLGFDPVQG
jgi:uncharacterized protein